MKGSLKRDLVVSCLAELLVIRPESASTIVDILAILDTETTCNPAKKDDRERLVGIVRDAEKYLPEGILKERMEIDTLGEAGVLKNAKKFFSTIIKLKTKLL